MMRPDGSSSHIVFRSLAPIWCCLVNLLASYLVKEDYGDIYPINVLVRDLNVTGLAVDAAKNPYH